jgi:hypothetical protein
MRGRRHGGQVARRAGGGRRRGGPPRAASRCWGRPGASGGAGVAGLRPDCAPAAQAARPPNARARLPPRTAPHPEEEMPRGRPSPAAGSGRRVGSGGDVGRRRGVIRRFWRVWARGIGHNASGECGLGRGTAHMAGKAAGRTLALHVTIESPASPAPHSRRTLRNADGRRRCRQPAGWRGRPRPPARRRRAPARRNPCPGGATPGGGARPVAGGRPRVHRMPAGMEARGTKGSARGGCANTAGQSPLRGLAWSGRARPRARGPSFTAACRD